jgi:threonine/homoserine/homoserine lactone efflux protein
MSSRFPDIDFNFLELSNIFFLILTGGVMFFVHRTSMSGNPHAFVRGVMGGMLSKMMITALAFIIALPWVKEQGATEILLCMAIYLIYLMLEVRFLTKNQKKANA